MTRIDHAKEARETGLMRMKVRVTHNGERRRPMTDHDGLHLLWVSDGERINIAGPFASETIARFTVRYCSPDAVLVDIRFIDDPAPLLKEG